MSNYIIKNIQLKRTNKATLPLELPEGEPIIALDSGELFVGQGPGKPLKQVRTVPANVVLFEGSAVLDNTTIALTESLSNFKQLMFVIDAGGVETITVDVSSFVLGGIYLKTTNIDDSPSISTVFSTYKTRLEKVSETSLLLKFGARVNNSGVRTENDLNNINIKKITGIK